MSREPEHITKTRELRAQMIAAADDADTQLRRVLVCATALAHPIQNMEPITQAILWLAHHSQYTENSRETEEIIEGVLPVSMGVKVSDERKAELLAEAEAIVEQHPNIATRIGRDAALAFAYSNRLDIARCGHLPYRAFIECVIEDDE